MPTPRTLLKTVTDRRARETTARRGLAPRIAKARKAYERARLTDEQRRPAKSKAEERAWDLLQYRFSEAGERLGRLLRLDDDYARIERACAEVLELFNAIDEE